MQSLLCNLLFPCADDKMIVMGNDPDMFKLILLNKENKELLHFSSHVFSDCQLEKHPVCKFLKQEWQITSACLTKPLCFGTMRWTLVTSFSSALSSLRALQALCQAGPEAGAMPSSQDACIPHRRVPEFISWFPILVSC